MSVAGQCTCTRVTLVLACLMALLAYRYYVAVPDEFSDRITIGVAMSVQRIVVDVCKISSLISGYDYYYLREKVLEVILGAHKEPAGDMHVEDIMINDVAVRVYTPGGLDDGLTHPAIVFYHGGGYAIGTIEIYHTIVYELALESNTQIYSVGYRRAPEHLFPVVYEDCLNVTKYIMTHHKQFGVDARRVAIMGDSAGGQLAASVAQELKNTATKPKLQILVYPILQFIDLQTPSYQQNGDSRLMSAPEDAVMLSQIYLLGYVNATVSDMMLRGTHISSAIRKRLSVTVLNHHSLPNSYFPKRYKKPDLSDDAHINLPRKQQELFLDTRMSPLLADDVSGLPTTYIYTAEYDPLRDDGRWYADRLRQAGVSVHHDEQRASFHGILFFLNDVVEGKKCLMSIVDFIKNHL